MKMYYDVVLTDQTRAEAHEEIRDVFEGRVHDEGRPAYVLVDHYKDEVRVSVATYNPYLGYVHECESIEDLLQLVDKLKYNSEGAK